MAQMEIVIKIPEEKYNEAQERLKRGYTLGSLDMAILSGTVLPKGHKSDEWCTDCKEYDTEKHCCPRFNRVIRETLNETSKPKGKWIFCGYATERDWELGIKSFKCSVCDKKGDWKSPCCPHCGVKMEVDE